MFFKYVMKIKCVIFMDIKVSIKCVRDVDVITIR